jgi:hypothetical protein
VGKFLLLRGEKQFEGYGATGLGGRRKNNKEEKFFG